MKEVFAIKSLEAIKDLRFVLREKNMRDEVLFILGINTGIRISDLLKLKKSDVFDIQWGIRDYVEIIEQKTQKIKIVYLSEEVKNILRIYIRDEVLQNNDYLFRSREGLNKPISRQQAYRILSDAAEYIGMKESIGTHTLRKTFGYHAYKNGTGLELLMKIFNHYSKSDTLRYIGITQDDIKSVYISSNLG